MHCSAKLTSSLFAEAGWVFPDLWALRFTLYVRGLGSVWGKDPLGHRRAAAVLGGGSRSQAQRGGGEGQEWRRDRSAERSMERQRHHMNNGLRDYCTVTVDSVRLTSDQSELTQQLTVKV